MKNEGISEVIRHEEELKAKMQQTERFILEGRLDRQQLETLKSLIGEEDVLLKYLQVESSQLQPQVRKLYDRNVLRFKKKIKEHKEYVNSEFGQGAIGKYHDPYKIGQNMQWQNQNAKFIDQKRNMYENEMLQNDIGRDIHRQGFYLQGQIEKNREIRHEADLASNSIQQIKQAIFKRKLMFFSLFVFLAIAIIIVILKRVFKVI